MRPSNVSTRILAEQALSYLAKRDQEFQVGESGEDFENSHLYVLNTGQACICPNRVFVQRGVAESFIDTLVERVGRLRPGNGLDDGVTVGPLIDEPALEKMRRQVDDARTLGARVRVGGDRLAGEAFARGQFGHRPS